MLFLKKKKVIDILINFPQFFFVELHFSLCSDQALSPHAVDASWTKYPCVSQGGGGTPLLGLNAYSGLYASGFPTGYSLQGHGIQFHY